ncbi:MAG: hypothetical protein AAF355_14355 [Myxococcota bacterium]
MRILLYCLCWSLLWLPLTGTMLDASVLMTGWAAPAIGFGSALSPAGWQGTELQTTTLPWLLYWSGVLIAALLGIAGELRVPDRRDSRLSL